MKLISQSNYNIYQSSGFTNSLLIACGLSYDKFSQTCSHFSLHLSGSSLVSLEGPTLFRVEVLEEIYSSPPHLQQQTHGLFATRL